MVQRRVLRLHYTLEDNTHYEGCPAIEGKGEGFRYRLDSGHLTVEMEEPHTTVGDARKVAEAFLRAWEMDVALREGRGLLTFKHEGADVVEVGPAGQGKTVTSVLQDVSCTLDAIVVHRQRSEYPRPPSCFAVTPDVETMWHRLEMHHQSREPLASMAYFCLTVAEWVGGGGRPGAAKRLGISDNFLDAIGSLSAPHRHHLPERQVSGHEEDWLSRAVRLLIRRVAEVAKDPSTADRQITLTDHPLPKD